MIKQAVHAMLQASQAKLCAALEAIDGRSFHQDRWHYQAGSGGGDTRILQGAVFEKAGVNVSCIHGEQLPLSAVGYAAWQGSPFDAMGLSVVIHPLNPYVPSVHLNVRLFYIHHAEKSGWWFGGGADLTPYYGFDEDCVHWHRCLQTVCNRYDPAIYAIFKQQCDDYFYLKHRQEHRGIGGIFFENFNAWPFDICLAFVTDVAHILVEAYLPIVAKRKDLNFTDHHRDFQQYRRGRYVEFNLLYDRGTRFGIESQGRMDSIFMSMPPIVQWPYQYHCHPGSAEEKLHQWYLQPKNWSALDHRDEGAAKGMGGAG